MDIHMERCIFMPGVGSPIKHTDQGLTVVPCSKPEHQWPLHHSHHLLYVRRPWKKSKSPPTHQPSTWVCFTTQGNYWHSGATGYKGKECWTQPAKHSPGKPIPGKAVKLWLECCSTPLNVKNTQSHICTCQNTFTIITHLSLTLWQGGRLPQPTLFMRTPGPFLPSQGHLWGTHCR